MTASSPEQATAKCVALVGRGVLGRLRDLFYPNAPVDWWYCEGNT